MEKAPCRGLRGKMGFSTGHWDRSSRPRLRRPGAAAYLPPPAGGMCNPLLRSPPETALARAAPAHTPLKHKHARSHTPPSAQRLLPAAAAPGTQAPRGCWSGRWTRNAVTACAGQRCSPGGPGWGRSSGSLDSAYPASPHSLRPLEARGVVLEAGWAARMRAGAARWGQARSEVAVEWLPLAKLCL